MSATTIAPKAHAGSFVKPLKISPSLSSWRCLRVEDCLNFFSLTEEDLILVIVLVYSAFPRPHLFHHPDTSPPDILLNVCCLTGCYKCDPSDRIE